MDFPDAGIMLHPFSILFRIRAYQEFVWSGKFFRYPACLQ